MAKSDFKHALGVRAKDKLSGFEGVITARVEFLTGCDRYCVTPTELHEHKPVDGIYFDEAQLTILPEPGVKPEEVQSKKPGACSPNPAK